MNKSIDKNLRSTGFRLYKEVYSNGIQSHVLVSWVQRRCEKCQRFLSKFQSKYCSKCAKESYLEKQREYDRSHSHAR